MIELAPEGRFERDAGAVAANGERTLGDACFAAQGGFAGCDLTHGR